MSAFLPPPVDLEMLSIHDITFLKCHCLMHSFNPHILSPSQCDILQLFFLPFSINDLKENMLQTHNDTGQTVCVRFIWKNVFIIIIIDTKELSRGNRRTCKRWKYRCAPCQTDQQHNLQPWMPTTLTHCYNFDV